MKKQGNVCIGTGRIKGLNKGPCYSEHHGFYIFNIMFEKTSTLLFNNISFIKVGETQEESECICRQIKKNFSDAGIHEGDTVAVVFGESNGVLAIAKSGSNVWIDVNDRFVVKSFAELKIAITSLKVY